MSDSFGRNEMESFLGRPSLDEGRNSQVSFNGGFQMRQSKKPKSEKSLDELSPLETAAHLAENVTSSQAKEKARRYRTNRVLQHHQLAAELLQTRHSSESKGRRQNDSDSEDSFVTNQQVTNGRPKTLPKEVNTLHTKLKSKARNLYASSSSESEPEVATSGRRTPPDSSEDEVISRRKKRKRNSGSELVVPSSGSHVEPQEPILPLKRKNEDLGLDHLPPKKEHTSESSSDSSESSSSDHSSDSADESTTVDVRPQFIPKTSRRIEKSYEQVEEAYEKRSRIRADRVHSRKLESRAMVAKQVSLVAPNTDGDYMEESYGASNIIPDDANVSDEDVIVFHRDAWELREIERLLAVLRQEREKETRQLAYERRKQLTDEQVMDEDRQSGRYIPPGKNRLNKASKSHRYYHRGAYYMDEEEWDDADVRYKSADYASAATGEDKLDKSMLPEVMRRNKFGFARQNTKYKGLAGEDTSEARAQALPIVERKRSDCRSEK